MKFYSVKKFPMCFHQDLGVSHCTSCRLTGRRLLLLAALSFFLFLTEDNTKFTVLFCLEHLITCRMEKLLQILPHHYTDASELHNRD